MAVTGDFVELAVSLAQFSPKSVASSAGNRSLLMTSSLPFKHVRNPHRFFYSCVSWIFCNFYSCVYQPPAFCLHTPRFWKPRGNTLSMRRWTFWYTSQEMSRSRRRQNSTERRFLPWKPTCKSWLRLEVWPPDTNMWRNAWRMIIS